MTAFNNFTSLGADALQEARAKFKSQLDQWNKWTSNQVAPVLQEEAEALQRIKIINDNVVALVTVVRQNAVETQKDVTELAAETWTSTSDLMSAFDISMTELEDSISKAIKTIGDSTNGGSG